jgi:hypothetical protein
VGNLSRLHNALEPSAVVQRLKDVNLAAGSVLVGVSL